MRDARQKELHRLTNARWRERHRPQCVVASAKWLNSNPGYRKTRHLQHPELQWNHDLKKRYGITWADKLAIYKEQKGLCKLCESPLQGPSGRDTHVEHKPISTIIRGLVHNKCNQLIRVVEASPHLIEAVKKYLDG